MKKLILSIIALAAISTASAQEKNFYWGAKFGVNFAGTIGDGADASKNSRMGAVGGLFGEYYFNEKMSGVVEALYSQQGYTQTVAGVETKAKFQFVNIPVLYNYYITPNFAAKAGVQFGIPVDSKVDITGDTPTPRTNVKIDPKFDISIPVGVSYMLDMGLIFDLRYNIGLTKVYDDQKMRNSVAQLTVGWRF